MRKTFLIVIVSVLIVLLTCLPTAEAKTCPEGERLECVETKEKCVTKTHSNTVQNEDGTMSVEVEEYEECSGEECVRYECR